jgi:hypothetical protein
MGLSSLAPLTRASPIHFPTLPTSITSISLLSFACEVLTAPVVLGLSYNILQVVIKQNICALLQQSVTRPNDPDFFSLKFARGDELTSVAIRHLAKVDRAYSPSLVGSVWKMILGFRRWAKRISLWPRPTSKRTPLPAHLEASFRARATLLFRQRIRLLRRNGEMLQSTRRKWAEVSIVQAWMQYAELDECFQNSGRKPDDVIDLEQWITELQLDVVDDASTATPEPDPLFNAQHVNIADQIENGVSQGAQTSHETMGRSIFEQGLVNSIDSIQGRNDHHIQQNSRTDVVDALDSHQNSQSLTEALHEAPARSMPPLSNEVISPLPADVVLTAISPSRVEREAIPSPGITRAQSLTIPSMDWPLDFDGSAHQSPELWQIEPNRPTLHRVTILSSLAANIFAQHAAALLTTAVLLPIESRFVRSLALGFLNSPTRQPGAAASAVGIRNDVRGLGFGWNPRYLGNLVLLLSLQGLVSAGIWGSMTALSIKIGKSFGWGQL